MGAASTRQDWGCPERLGPIPTGRIVGSDGGGYVAGQGQALLSAEGTWSNCDVYLSIPNSWVAADPTLRLWTVVGGIRSLIATTTIGDALAPGGGLTETSSGGATGIVLSGRGHPCDAWNVDIVTGASLDPASAALELWGRESTPENIGPTPGNGMADASMASRASHLMGWYGTDRRWLPVAVSSTGQLITNGGGGGGGMSQITIPAASGAVAIDPATDSGWRVEAVGDVVLTPSSSFVEGVDYVVYFVQDATGYRQLTFDGGITVDLPDTDAGLLPGQAPNESSALLFRAVSATELQLVATVATETYYTTTDSVISSVGEDLYIEGGTRTPGVGNPTGDLVLSVGPPNAAGANLTAKFTIVAFDDTSPIENPYNMLRAAAVGDGGSPNVPQSQIWTWDLPVSHVIDTPNGITWEVTDATLVTAYFSAQSFATYVWSNGITRIEAVSSIEVTAPEATLGDSGDPRLEWDANATTIYKSRVRFTDLPTGGTLVIDTTCVIGDDADLPPGSAAIDGQTIIVHWDALANVTPDGTDLINGASTPVTKAAGAQLGFIWRQSAGTWYTATA